MRTMITKLEHRQNEMRRIGNDHKEAENKRNLGS